MGLSFQTVRGVRSDVPFSEDNTATVLRINMSVGCASGNCERLSTLTTWSEYSSPSIRPPARVMSFLTMSRLLLPIPPFDNDERSLIGAKTLRRDPYVVRRNLIWLMEKDQPKTSIDIIHLLPNLCSTLSVSCQRSQRVSPELEKHTWSHSKNV